MISKQFLISFLTALSIACLLPGGESFARSGNGRTAGYHGNVMVTDHLGVFVGLGTSHGYMLLSQREKLLGFGHENRLVTCLNYDNGGVNYKNGIFSSPTVGRSRLLNSGKGLSIGLGGRSCLCRRYFSDLNFDLNALIFDLLA